MSDIHPSRAKFLKRKSLDGSSGRDDDSNTEAPIKRFKVEDITGASAEPDGVRPWNGHNTEDDGTRRRDTEAKDAFLDEESVSPIVQRPAKVGGDVPLSADKQRRRPSDSKTGDMSPPPRRSDRRDSEVSRSSYAFEEKGRNRRESLNQEEKKRGKRLFGGLLSTLSQTTTNSQQKRRQEIEKRQQEKATKQRIEDDKCRSEKLAKLERARRIEQVRFDEQVMRTRHSNMLASAHSLQTKSVPKLYYRPWELTPEQEDIIKDQIRDAEARIEDEVQHFKRRKEQRLEELGALPSAPGIDSTVGEPVEDRPNATPDESAISDDATNNRKPSPAPAPAPKTKISEDKDHFEMVEAEEDTVIY